MAGWLKSDKPAGPRQSRSHHAETAIATGVGPHNDRLLFRVRKRLISGRRAHWHVPSSIGRRLRPPVSEASIPYATVALKVDMFAQDTPAESIYEGSGTFMGDVGWIFWLVLCLAVAIPYLGIYWHLKL